MNAPPICSGNGLCDPRIPHICYQGLDTAEPWLTGAPRITKIGLRLNMDERATMEAVRAERRAAKARRRAQ